MNLKGPGFWNLPNTLTVVRILLVPVVVLILLDEPGRLGNIAACAIFVGAMITDIIDGWLARLWGLTSPAGAYLDPMADKLMHTTVLVMLIPLGRAPAWLVALLLCRELAITGLRGIASQEGVLLPADVYGKIKTAYQSAGLGLILFHDQTLGFDVHSAGMVVLYIGTFFSLLSAVQYFLRFFRATALGNRPSS